MVKGFSWDSGLYEHVMEANRRLGEEANNLDGSHRSLSWSQNLDESCHTAAQSFSLPRKQIEPAEQQDCFLGLVGRDGPAHLNKANDCRDDAEKRMSHKSVSWGPTYMREVVQRGGSSSSEEGGKEEPGLETLEQRTRPQQIVQTEHVRHHGRSSPAARTVGAWPQDRQTKSASNGEMTAWRGRVAHKLQSGHAVVM